VNPLPGARCKAGPEVGQTLAGTSTQPMDILPPPNSCIVLARAKDWQGDEGAEPGSAACSLGACSRCQVRAVCQEEKQTSQVQAAPRKDKRFSLEPKLD